MADIRVTGGEGSYRVTVTEGGSSTEHEVTADPTDVDRLVSESSPARLVEASFRFLLDREPKESILRRFDLRDISRFFEEYESEIGGYL